MRASWWVGVCQRTAMLCRLLGRLCRTPVLFGTWDTDECVIDNGGCGDPRLHWCENRCGAWPLCHARDGEVLDSSNNSASVGPTVQDPATGDLAPAGPGIVDHTLCPAVPQCDSFLVQGNMSNPKEHCNLGFHHLCLVEGGAFD